MSTSKTLAEYDAERIAACLIPYKDREVDLTKPVHVYRNLHGKNWSIRQRGKVAAHAENLMLRDAQCVVQLGGWSRYAVSGKRNVHAYIKGIITGSAMGTEATASSRLGLCIRYELSLGIFVYAQSGNKCKGAQAVRFQGNKVEVVYSY